MKKSVMRATLGRTAPLVQLLEPLRRAGFEGIQLGILEGVGELTLRTGDADVRKLAKACRDAGIEPHSISGGARFLHESAAERKRTLDQARRVIEIAALLGARTWLIHPGHLTAELPYDDCWKYTLEGLNELKRQAEATHLKIGLENVWNRFLMSPLEFVRLLEEVNSPAVGIWFDIGNVVAIGYPEQWLRIVGAKHLVGIHVKDFRRGTPGDIFGTAQGFVPIFHGDVNWPVVMRQLAALGFDDYLITEVAMGHQPLPDAFQTISHQLDVLIAMAKEKSGGPS